MAVICKLLYPMRSSGEEETDDVSYLVLFWIVFGFCFFFLFCFVFVRLQFLLIKWTFKIILFSAIKHSHWLFPMRVLLNSEPNSSSAVKLYLYVLTCHLLLNVSSQISCTTVSVFYLFTNTFRAWDGLDKKSYFVDIDFTCLFYLGSKHNIYLGW